jgi:O-antigen/teichoic acid export membrane protein
LIAEQGIGFRNALTRMNRRGLWLGLIISPPIVWALFGQKLGLAIGLSSHLTLPLLAIAMPFALPLSLARGVATGDLHIRQVVLSANLEMLVRLVGGVVAWQIGLGLEGVVVAIAASIMVGWLCVQPSLKVTTKRSSIDPPVLRLIAIAALPFAALQVSQVALLDGDVFFAKAYMSDTQAGYIAALGLLQRIQFFACFGLASALLPVVAQAVAKGDNAWRAARPVFVIFAMVTMILIGGLTWRPDLAVLILVGPKFQGAAAAAPLAGWAAAAFTGCYLLITFLTALGDRRAAWFAVVLIPIQFSTFFAFAKMGPGLTPEILLTVKACVLAALTVILMRRTLRVMRSRKAVLVLTEKDMVK